MAEVFTSSVTINRTGTTNAAIILNADTGDITTGNFGVDGDILLKDGSNVTRIHLDPGNHTIVIRNASNQVIAELGRNGNLRLGGGGLEGDIEMLKGDNQRTVHVDANEANIWLGGNGADGDIVIFPSGVANSNSTAEATIHLDGNAGDITLRNADCAEDFDVVGHCQIEPGMVLVLDEEGKLRPSELPYDFRVAGVVSGASAYKPGMIFDRQPGLGNRQPIALAGKTYCRVDASYGPVRVGDLLTTSATPGCAMRAADPQRAFGAVIGKALKPLTDGLALIPILVALQ